MKLRDALPGGLLLLVQIPVGWAVLVAMLGMRLLWSDLGNAELPLLTVTALRAGVAIPAVAAVAAGGLLAASLRRRNPLLGWAFAVALAELVCLAVFVFALAEPTLRINCGMGR